MPSFYICEVIKIICIYDSKETDFNNNGLVVLDSCIFCIIPEELNGAYELELEYPILNNNKWQYLVEGNIIKADGQLFRMYHKVKTLTSIKINARHIFYDLLDNFLEDITLNNVSGANALDSILNNTQYPHKFISMSDVSNLFTANYAKKNPIEILVGTDGVINNIGGELVRDNFTIKLLQTRGLDRGVLISYGKNIVGIEETLDIDGICTRLMPVGKDGLLLFEKYIDSQYINNFPHPKIKVVEFSDCENEATLRAMATKYMVDNKIDIPQFNYAIDFVELSKTEEYKNYAILESVYMGDTITIKHSKLNINLKAKVIKITKNCITNRIEKVELGSFKPNLATSISNSIQNVQVDIVNTKSSLQTAIDTATTQINSALGGYVVKRNGELLIMDTEDVNTATKVWKWNENGLGYGTSYNGPFRTAITADGHMVADFMDAGTLNAELINVVGLVVGENITMGTNAVIKWDNLTTETQTNLKGEQGIQGIQGAAGSYYAPDWITATSVSGGEVISPLLQGNKIYTSASKEYWLILSGATIQFMHNGAEIFKMGISSEAGNEGKPQLFFNNGCSIDTYEGSLRLRTSATNYIRVNKNDGGVDYVTSNSTTSLTGAGINVTCTAKFS